MTPTRSFRSSRAPGSVVATWATRACAALVASSLAFLPMGAQARVTPPAEAAPAAAPASAPVAVEASTTLAAEPLRASGQVAIFRIEGGDTAAAVRAALETEFEGQGFTVKQVALDLASAAKKVKCRKADPVDCLDLVGKWLGQKDKTRADFIVYGRVEAGDGAKAKVVVYGVAAAKTVVERTSRLFDGDYIAPLVFPRRIALDLAHLVVPPGGATAEESQILASLDEPAKTPEELAAEKKAIADAEAEAANVERDAVDTSGIEVDLKADFKAFCRNEPRKKRKSKEDDRDWRPDCKKGTFWGYWQPRAYVTLGLLSATGVATIAAYGLALGKHAAYTDARDALEAYDAKRGSGPLTEDPGRQGVASDLSEAGFEMRRTAIAGDALLGASVVLAGLLTVMIFQDRAGARAWMKDEKGVRAISDFRVGPMLTKRSQGLGLGFRF